MYIIRFNKEALRINICNSCPNLELTSPVYCSNGTCHVSPSQQISFGITLEASFRIDSKPKDFKGALLYKLQRKYTTKNDNQPNSGTASIENTVTNTHLLVILDFKNGWDYFLVCLIEFTDDLAWNKDKLWALCRQYIDQLYKSYSYKRITWLTHEGAVIRTRLEETYGSDYKLDIFIYEETGTYSMFRPMKIDPKRLVLSLSILIVLMYTVSLCIQPSVKLNIHNQCWNVDLVFPTYTTGDGLECYRSPDYKVYAGETMRSAFIINKADNAFYGVLIYKLQRERLHESTEVDEDTSSATHLLVIWCIPKLNKFYTGVMLVEYDKALTWNRLNKLYHANHDKLKMYTDITTDTWFMDDNMILKTTLSARNLNGNPELNISIFEEGDEYAMRPFRIDLTR
jgi:hypothetical protein